MNTMRAAVIAVLTMLPAASAFAQSPGSGAAGQIASMGGQSVGHGPRPQQPTPLFVQGELMAGIWTRMSPPYDATANRNGAANPLP